MDMCSLCGVELKDGRLACFQPARPCVICGAEFQPVQINQVTCSRECSSERHRGLINVSSRARRKVWDRACVICGKRFKPRTTEVTCSAECRAKRLFVGFRPRTCVICRRQFKPTHSQQKACHGLCRIELKRRHDRNRVRDPEYIKQWHAANRERRREQARHWPSYYNRNRSPEQRERSRHADQQLQIKRRAALRVLAELGIEIQL
jgi:hypothetical protein